MIVLKIKDKGKTLDTDALPVFPLPLWSLSGSGLDSGQALLRVWNRGCVHFSSRVAGKVSGLCRLSTGSDSGHFRNY